jgi:glucokinase
VLFRSRGDDNTAFELGHIITRGGEYDSSGKTKAGRFEYYASIMGLERIGGGESAWNIIDGVMTQNKQAMKIYDGFIYELALGMLTVIALFKPEVIALGGGLSAAGNYLLEGIREKINELCVWRNRLPTKIHLAVHKNNAGMIGAAALAQLYLAV